MKITRLVLVVSLAANAALLAVRWPRSAPTTPAAAPAVARGSTSATQAAAAREAALLAALANGDSAALAAAGVPGEVVAQLAAARAFGRLAKIVREQDHPAGPPAEYWRANRPAPRPRFTPEQRAARAAAEREFDVAMRAAFGPDPFGGTGDGLAFLPDATRERLRQIERDYDEMARDVSQQLEGVQLPADREKWRLLEAEKQRDIAGVLSPAERAEMELRTSPSARTIIERYGDIVSSEEEYKRLYARQKAFDDQYSTPDFMTRQRTPEENRARAEAERKLNDDLRAAVGEDRWATLSRDNDVEFRSLNALAARLGLPTATADQIYALRDAYAAQSVALNQNTALTTEQRAGQLRQLATNARNDVRARLGFDGGDAYAQQAAWLQMLQNGSAFTTDARLLPPGSPRPPGNTTVFPLPAPRPRPPPKR